MPIRWFLMSMLLCLGGVALLPGAGYGAATRHLHREATGTAAQRVVLQAETLEYVSAEHRMIASGAVTVEYGEARLFADRLELNTQTGVGFASGQVRLLTPEDDIHATRLEFELSSERGVLYDGTGIVAQFFMVSGKRITRSESRTFSVYEGRVTTCTDTVPDWEFRAREAHIGLGDYVTLKHPSFWIKGVPVFYVPYFIVPLKDERTTGFLPPHVGGSSRDGVVVGTEFFWAMAKWMDTTVGLEYLSERGWRPEAELRYAIDPWSDGQVYGSFLHDQDTGENIWKVLLQQRHEFGWGIRGLTQLDLRSRQDLDREFSRDTTLEAAVQTDSFGTLTKRFGDGALTVAGEVHEGIRDRGSDEVFRRLPRVRFTQFPTSILGLAFFAMETSYTRLSDTEVVDDTAVQRLDIFPQLTVPVALPPWMRLSITGGVRETLYDRRVTSKSDLSRELFDLQARLHGPLLWRRYGATESRRGILHMVEPQVAYRYIPRREQDDIPAFDTLDEAQHFLDPFENDTLLDRIAAANYVKVLFINRLYTHNAAQGGLQEMMRVMISQGFDMRRSAASGGQLFGPLDIEMDMQLWPRWWMASTVRLAPTTGALQESDWRLRFIIHPSWAVQVGNYYRQSPDILYVSGGLHVSLSEELQLGYTWRYDGLRGVFHEHEATLSYRAQCWRVDVRFRVREQGDTEFVLRANIWQF